MGETIRTEGCSPFIVEFWIPQGSSDIQRAFIEVPWELLANETRHLAKDTSLCYSPVRRIGDEEKTKRVPSEYGVQGKLLREREEKIKLAREHGKAVRRKSA